MSITDKTFLVLSLSQPSRISNKLLDDKLSTAEHRSRGFHGTGKIISINWNFFTVNKEINTTIITHPDSFVSFILRETNHHVVIMRRKLWLVKYKSFS